jgi:hypothetical protein
MADLRDALHVKQAYPDRHRYISQGEITTSHGLLQHTPTSSSPSHRSFWRFKDVTMHAIFDTLP